MAQTGELGSSFSILGHSMLLGVRTLSDFDRLPGSTVELGQEAVCRFPPNPFHVLINRMQLSADSSIELGYLYLLLKTATYSPRSWTLPTPAREVLYRLNAYDGEAYRRLAFVLNEEVEKETR